MEHISQNISTMGGMMMGEKGGRLVVVVFLKILCEDFLKMEQFIKEKWRKR